MDTSRDNLYDQYLDAAASGRAEVPDDFLRRHGVEDAELLVALRSIHANLAKTNALLDAVNGAGNGLVDGVDGLKPDAQWVGEFELLNKLGEGGMGVVWLAKQRSLGRVVALKLLRADAAMSTTASERFVREARAVAKLRHPGIVAIHAMGDAAGCVDGVSGRFSYIAMEYVEGRVLDHVLQEFKAKREFMPTPRVIRWGIALARALHAAHSVGIVHRDVKPSNVLIPRGDDSDGTPKLLDFGLARDVSSRQATISDAFVGSPFYAAPEQVARRGGEVDARTDVYALGSVLYEAMTNTTTAHGTTLEHVLRSILVDEVSSPRVINPRVSKDMATVILKALEKEPSRRYATAAALADDLEAILELRAISARPATAWERARRWSRRHRALSAGLVTALGAAVVFGGVLTYQNTMDARAKREEVRRLIGESRAGIKKYNQLAAEVRDVEEEYARIAPERGSRYFTDEEDAALAATARKVESVRQDRETLFDAGQVNLARAERLGAPTRDVQKVRADWYVAAALDAEVRGDMKRRSMFAELARVHDVDGDVDKALIGTGSLSITSEPAGAEVFLFRRPMLEQREGQDEPRRVLEPVKGWGALAGRTTGFGLRVVRGNKQIAVGTMIVEVAGFGIRESVLVSSSNDSRIARFDRLLRVDGSHVEGDYDRDALMKASSGTKRTLTLERRGVGVFDVTCDAVGALGLVLREPDELVREAGVPISVLDEHGIVSATSGEGLQVRTTALLTPLITEARVGITPTAAISLEPGAYVAIARAEGRELTRFAGIVERSAPTEWHLVLPELGMVPPGFVCVQDGAGNDRFWIMEREVTCREYFEFLNDPPVRQRALESTQPILYPRDGESARGERDAAGNYVLPKGWEWDWPILFISWHDASEYAEWRTRKAQQGGHAWTFSLPTLLEWASAAAQAPGDQYVFGDEFRPKWVSSCFARMRPDPEAVMRFPIDESVLAVFDLAGSVSEWSSDLYRPGYSYRRYMGGAWGTGDPADFAVYGGNGMVPERVGGMIGLRLVLRVKVDGGGVDAANEHAKTSP